MKLDIKITEYKKNIETLQAVESLDVQRWLISLGEKLNHDPLSKEKIIIPPRKKLTFKPSKNIKDEIYKERIIEQSFIN